MYVGFASSNILLPFSRIRSKFGDRFNAFAMLTTIMNFKKEASHFAKYLNQLIRIDEEILSFNVIAKLKTGFVFLLIQGRIQSLCK